MICCPRRSFWEERLARNAAPVVVRKLAQRGTVALDGAAAPDSSVTVKQQLGPGVLIFGGCRNSSTEYIYADTIQVRKPAAYQE